MFQFIPLISIAAQKEELVIQEVFDADLLSVSLQIDANLDRLNVSLGTIYQYFDSHCAAYIVTRAKIVFKLLMPKTDCLLFVPSDEFYTSYGLALSHATLPTGTMSNDYILPDIIEGLPVRVDALEASQEESTVYFGNINTILESLEGMQPVTWSTLQGIPSAFAPTSHTHEARDLPTSSGTNSISPLLINSDQILESGKSYLATVAGLRFTLPASPAIGDVIEVSSGDFDTRVEQNTAQSIRNLNTQTVTGADRGIVLKNYSSVQLMFDGASLWISKFRNRIVNNYEPLSIEPVSSMKAYTASLHTPVALAYGTTVGSINNNALNAGDYSTNGLLSDTPNVKILATFPSPIRMDSFDFYSGQGNIGSGSGNDSYKVSTINVYGGNNLNTLLGTFSPTNANGVKQSFGVNTGELSYGSYVFEFVRAGNGIGVLELDLFGRSQLGGEILVV